MRADDWSRLRPLCAQIVVIGEYRRISRNEWSAAELAKLASRADGFGSNRKDPAQEPAMGSIAFHQVRRGQPMDAATRAAFRSLCGSVRFAVDNWSDRIRTGETIESEECSLFYGPATECRMISNEEWRIEYARVGGRWRVARLLRLEH